MPRLLAVVAASLVLSPVLTSCGGAPPVTQLEITSLVTTCGTSSDDCEGPPAEGAVVEVTRGADEVAASRVLDAGGRAELNLDPGEYRVVVTLGELRTGPAEVVLSPGQHVTLAMNLPKPPS